VCNPFICASYPVSVAVAQVPRPPVIAPQNASIAEGSPAFASLSPAIFASQPQALALNFSVIPSTDFGIGATTGVLFLQPGRSLVFANQSTYTLTCIVLSSAGTQASAPITVFVTQVIKPPAFTAPVYSLTVNESTPAGVAFGSTPATSTNLPADTFTYSIVGTNPAGASSWFAINPSTAALSVAPGLSQGLLVDRALAYPAGPWTVNVSLAVRIAGGLTANATALVAITFIAPRVEFLVNGSVANNVSALTRVATLLPAVWTPYPPSTLSFTFVSAAKTSSGVTALTITNTSSGAVVVASYAWPTTSGAFDVLTSLYSTWQVTDALTGLSATGGLQLAVIQSNRAPSWDVPKANTVVFAPQSTAASPTVPFGSPLGPYASDLDSPLGIGELLTFSLVTASNPGGAFAIDPLSGQLSIATPGAPALATIGNNITLGVAVRDAGINGPVFWAYTNITVAVVFAHNAPTMPPYAFSVNELSAAGTWVGNVTGWSQNFMAIMTYTISPANAEATCPFAIASVLTGSTMVRRVLECGPEAERGMHAKHTRTHISRHYSQVGVITVGQGAVLQFGPGPRQYRCSVAVSDNAPSGSFVAVNLTTINVSCELPQPHLHDVAHLTRPTPLPPPRRCGAAALL